TEVAQVRDIAVSRGDHVAAGQPVAHMEARDASIAVAQAEAALAQAEAALAQAGAQLADLRQGKRPEEIAVLQAALAKAQAEAVEAARALKRVQDLSARGIATQAEHDRAKTTDALARAEVGQASANLAVARLPARAEAIEAASHRRDEAAAALEQARWRLSRRVIEAPKAG